jgi:hypothetical protein
MEPLSARIPSDLYLWLAQLPVEGATTNSDKLRVLLSRIKRQHDGAMDYPTAHSWARDIAAPLRDALVSLEDKTGKTSEVLNLLLDHVTASLAMIVSHTPATETEAAELEELLVRRLFGLSSSLLRQATTEQAQAYDPAVVRRHMGTTIELANNIPNPLKEREMVDSLKTRVGRIIAGSAHALVDHLENQAPQAAMEQTVREVDAIIADVRHELGIVSANRHLAQQQHSKLNGHHAQLVDQVQQALSLDRDDWLARPSRANWTSKRRSGAGDDIGRACLQGGRAQRLCRRLAGQKREMSEAIEEFIRSRAATTSGTKATPAVPTQQRLESNRLFQPPLPTSYRFDSRCDRLCAGASQPIA